MGKRDDATLRRGKLGSQHLVSSGSDAACAVAEACAADARACSAPRWAIVAQDSVQCTELRQQSACCCLCCCFCCCCCCVQRSRRSVLILCAKVRTCCSLRVL